MEQTGMERTELAAYLDELLDCSRFRDYSPNGLQVEGRARIRRIIGAVSASRAAIEAACDAGADALLVHHGWFWRNEDPRLVGWRHARLKRLLDQDINLLAYHLPLDAHAEYGNNACLGRRMGWQAEARFAEQDIAFLGRCAPMSAGAIAERLTQTLARPALLVGEASRTVERIAWCSGAGQGFFEQAIAAGAQLYVSGEISEPTTHLARESGVPYIAAGHHATERYGVQALGAHLAERFGVRFDYVELDNPA